jgi:hypothetical protein
MATIATSGSSTRAGSTAAASDAFKEAQEGLGGAASFGFVFSSTKHKLDEVMRTVRELAPRTDFVGCTTAGELTQRGLTKGGVAVMLVRSDSMVYQSAFAAGLKRDDAHGAAAELTARFADTAATAKSKRLLDSTTITLIDGLCGVGEKVVNGVVHNTRSYQQVVGGAAGDDGQFKATYVSAAHHTASDAAAALHIFSPSPWGVGVNHGLRPSTPKMVVTRAKGNVVYELDGKPAFNVYRDYARSKGVTLTRDNAGPFLMNNEIGVYFLNHLQRARAPLAVGRDGELTCAADIAEGSSVSILDGKRDDLIAAARAAAEEAKDALHGVKAAGVVLFDCICRGSILDREFQREIESVKSVFPSVPIVGFLTYGEIARYRGNLHGWHNTTAVVAAIPAV